MVQETGMVTATYLGYVPVYSEALINGGFETGDLSNWDLLYIVATVSPDYKSSLGSGNYGVYCYTYYGDMGEIYQSFSPRQSISTLSFDYKADIGLEILLYTEETGVYYFTIGGATEWTHFSIDGPFIDPETSQELYGFYCIGIRVPRNTTAHLDNISIITSTFEGAPCVSATIEDSSKSWSEGQFNNNGYFILTSGKAKGYSMPILDTHTNYIEVPTTYANIINNITSATTIVAATTQPVNGNFTSGTTGWDIDIESPYETEGYTFATGGIQTSTVYEGTKAFWFSGWSDGAHSCNFYLAQTATFDITNIGYISFWYNIPNIRGGDKWGTYFMFRLYGSEYGKINYFYTATTNGWTRAIIDVATLTGTTYMQFYGMVPVPVW